MQTFLIYDVVGQEDVFVRLRSTFCESIRNLMRSDLILFPGPVYGLGICAIWHGHLHGHFSEERYVTATWCKPGHFAWF